MKFELLLEPELSSESASEISDVSSAIISGVIVFFGERREGIVATLDLCFDSIIRNKM